MPRFLPSIIAGTLAVLLGGLATWAFMRLSAEPDWEFTGPGEFTFTAPKAGNYTVWHQATASIDGIYTVRKLRLPEGTTIAVRHSGDLVPTKVDGSNYVSGEDHGDKTSVLTFNASEPGEYSIEVSGIIEKHAFSLSAGLGLRFVILAMGISFAAMGALGLFAVLLIMALANIFPKKPAPPQIGGGGITLRS